MNNNSNNNGSFFTPARGAKVRSAVLPVLLVLFTGGFGAGIIAGIIWAIFAIYQAKMSEQERIEYITKQWEMYQKTGYRPGGDVKDILG